MAPLCVATAPLQAISVFSQVMLCGDVCSGVLGGDGGGVKVTRILEHEPFPVCLLLGRWRGDVQSVDMLWQMLMDGTKDWSC